MKALSKSFFVISTNAINLIKKIFPFILRVKDVVIFFSIFVEFFQYLLNFFKLQVKYIKFQVRTDTLIETTLIENIIFE